MKTHRHYLEQAIAYARTAGDNGEVPVGAIIVMGDRVIAAACNEVEAQNNPLAHAEVLAIRRAVDETDSKFIEGATLYCTLEPCPMCAGAAVHARVKRIVFGAADIRWGACGTLFNIPEDERLNHRIEVIGGVMEEECGAMMREFFEGKRRGE